MSTSGHLVRDRYGVVIFYPLEEARPRISYGYTMGIAPGAKAGKDREYIRLEVDGGHEFPIQSSYFQ